MVMQIQPRRPESGSLEGTEFMVADTFIMHWVSEASDNLARGEGSTATENPTFDKKHRPMPKKPAGGGQEVTFAPTLS